MNLIDLAVLAVVAGAVLNGARSGLVGIVTGLVGMIAGFLVGVAVAPTVTDWIGLGGAARALGLLTIVVVASSGGASLGQLAGMPLRRALSWLRLAWVDRAGGAVVGLVAALVLAWLIGGLLATGPSPALARAVQGSAILRQLDQQLPNTPEVIARAQTVLIDRGMPLPFAGFEPRAGTVDPPPAEAVAAAEAAAADSTVLVAAAGCGSGVTGSGVVVAPGVVLTNAHVVAGGHTVEVRHRGTDRRGAVVHFDPDTDVAVVLVEGLEAPPLPVATEGVGTGAGAAVLGYPEGRPLSVRPAAVLARQNAVGRDIWGRGLAVRDVYVLSAAVRSGDSGGPFVARDGTVLGLVFARSVAQSDVGYALSADELHTALDALPAEPEPVATASCPR